MAHFLIIEDELPVTTLFAGNLKTAWPDSVVTICHDRESAESALADQTLAIDLVILDIELAEDKYAGIGLINIVNKTRKCPVLVISGEPVHRPVMLELDAWDFLQKPVDDASFVAVVRSIIKQRQPSQPLPGEPASDGLVIDPLQSTSARWQRQRLNLPLTSLRVLNHLYGNRSSVVKKSELYQYLPTGRNDTNLRGHIQVIRDAFREIDESFDQIVTIPVKGYMWRD